MITNYIKFRPIIAGENITLEPYEASPSSYGLIPEVVYRDLDGFCFHNMVQKQKLFQEWLRDNRNGFQAGHMSLSVRNILRQSGVGADIEILVHDRTGTENESHAVPIQGSIVDEVIKALKKTPLLSEEPTEEELDNLLALLVEREADAKPTTTESTAAQVPTEPGG